ncbi:MAG TPA: BON domain-containing protein [Pyrinomonadaceae bacterium]|nr:BON domain-containing protein [Pyrinomonadaceae bacterium]
MSFDEEQKSSRVVVDTPDARREVVRTETIRGEERRGISTGAVAAIVVAAVALTAIAFMFLLNRGDDAPTADQRTGVAPTLAPAAPPQTTVIQQPAAVPPTTIIQQAPPTQMPMVAPTAAAPLIDDGTLQANVTNAIMNDADLATSDIEVTVLNAEATITGNVATVDLKRRADKIARAVKGLKKIDNKILVTGQEDAGTTTKTLP